MFMTSRAYFAYNNGGRATLQSGTYHQGTLAPGHEMSMTVDITVAPDEMRAFLEKKGEVRVDLMASYATAFGEDWKFEMDLMINKESIEKDNTIWTMACRQYPAKPGDEDEEAASHQRMLDLPAR
jgi:hypothetical protein